MSENVEYMAAAVPEVIDQNTYQVAQVWSLFARYLPYQATIDVLFKGKDGEKPDALVDTVKWRNGSTLKDIDLYPGYTPVAWAYQCLDNIFKGYKMTIEHQKSIKKTDGTV